ncbi:Metallo-dependent phosphatase-like protein [Pisolithus croceorrhizus]|nr:Metallo-dependent phosphatase-like protein [Pisolithus croceorrhizus]
MTTSTQDTQRSLVAGSVITFFLLFVFITGVSDELKHRRTTFLDGKQTNRTFDTSFPDFSQYNFLRTLSTEEFPIHGKHDRIITVGDIHGRNDSLSALLDKLSYDPRSDTLIHVGDIVTKGGVSGSVAVLSFLSSNNITGVRGNNDQDVIEWRAWRNWIRSLPGGREWLDKIDREHPVDDDEDEDEDDDDDDDDELRVAFWSEPSNKDWEDKVPKGWKLFQRHYNVARAMSQEHYDYLRSLPIVMHAPAGHTYFVHAGMLAADPKRELEHPKQPLSHWPATRSSKPKGAVLRSLQEVALLEDVPQNKDPWVLMNMRSVTDDGSISKGKKGTPWPELWNDVMDRCGGITDYKLSSTTSQLAMSTREGGVKQSRLPCFPSMIVYGHIAARGLDVKRWSVGLDSGCVYHRRLSALVLDKASFLVPHEGVQLEDAMRADDEHSPSLQYGDDGRARIVSVEC